MTSKLVVVTGAAGRIGGYLRPVLRAAGWDLRLVDLKPVEQGDGEAATVASVTDLRAMLAVCAGAAAVVHLGGLAEEDAWERILTQNIDGTRTVLEAARRTGVRRVVLASSNHAVGYAPSDGCEAPDYLYPRPDTYYGVSKVAMEALGSLYVDRYGMDVIALRIGSCRDRPGETRELTTWLSPGDAGRLVLAALTAISPGFVIAWGVSANTRRWWSLDAAHALGYQPQDDAEQYAADFDVPDPWPFLGGPFASERYDEPLE